MYTVYIIRSEKLDRYYSGMTTNLQRRLKKHRTGQTPSVQRSDDWDVVWSVKVETSSEARTLEKKIKGRGAARFLADQDD